MKWVTIKKYYKFKFNLDFQVFFMKKIQMLNNPNIVFRNKFFLKIYLLCDKINYM